MGLISTDRPDPGIVRLALNRPEKRHALSPDLRDALIAALAEAGGDDTVRAIVLTGTGGMFCAGGDLSTMGGLDAASALARMEDNHLLVRRLAGLTKPLVAAVEGYAMGAGAGLALWCDAIVAGQGAKLGFPFLKVGLVPDYALLFTLPRRVGPGIARRLFLMAETVPAPEALNMGLIDHLEPDAAVQDKALEVARGLAAQAPQAFARTKQLLLGPAAALDGLLRQEAAAQAERFLSAEHAEGIAAFLEKRPAKF